MRRLEICSYGSLRSAVRFAEAPVPTTGEEDVLVRVLAAGVNPIDYKIANGDLRRVQRLSLPGPMGFDCCGRIESIGSKVSGLAPGDVIYVRAPRHRMGSFAEYLAVDRRYVARAPANLSAIESASIPLVALTTVQALVDRARALPAQKALIHAGSGGLGSFAVQYAKFELGLHVTTTTSSKNVEWVRQLGADVVIAYDVQDYMALPARYDVVFDTFGGRTTFDSFSVLTRGGTVVSVAGPPDRAFARQVGANAMMSAVMWCMGLPMAIRARSACGRYFRFLTESDGSQLSHIKQVIESGKVRPVIDKVFSFGQAIEALEYVTTGRAKGKVVIQVSS